MNAPTGFLSSAFHEHVERRPHAFAITDGPRDVTYAELAACAGAVRRDLAALGLRSGDRVGVYMRRSWRVVVAILAINAHGCTYVPLDPDYPADRVRYMATDGELRAMCVDPGQDDDLPAIPRITVDGHARTAMAPAWRSLDTPHHVIYTSGSTGRPKGVVTPERAVLELFRSARERFSIGPDDVWAWFHSHCFDFSVWELWGALLHGGRIVVVPPDAARDPRRVLDILVAQRVTVLCQVPSMFKYLVWAREKDTRALALRYLVLGGEQIDRDTIRTWLDMPGEATVVNIYGPTETTVFSTCGVVDRAATNTTGPTNIGHALAHAGTAVVGQDDRPVRPGAEGELWVSGPAIAAGYQGRADLTADRFPVVDLGDGERRWYRTGDLVRQVADGSFEFLGRLDSQVKLRGFRIELGEIETVLRSIPGTDDAAALVHTPPHGEPFIVAHLVGQPPPVGELRRLCAAKLPTHMVPARFNVVSEFPLTPSGKLDQHALQAI